MTGNGSDSKRRLLLSLVGVLFAVATARCETSAVRYARELPVEAAVDVLVAGGGPAGVAAAVTAAEAGARVLIVEQTGSFGGAGTVAGVPELMNFDDGEHFLAGGFGRRIHDPLFGESKLRRECHCVQPERLKRLYDRLVNESGARTRFYTRLTDVIAENGHVQYAVLSDPSGVKALAAKVFVDATGSGFLATLAGAESDYGDENGVPMASTLCSEWGGVNFARKRGNDGRFAAKAHEEGVLSQYDNVLPGIKSNFPGLDFGLGNVGHLFAADDRSAESLTAAMFRGREILAEYENYYRRYIPGAEKATLVRTSDWLGVRASRRIRCEKTLTIDAFEGKEPFEDEIGRYSYPIDIHPVTADAKGMKDFVRSISKRHGKGGNYSIPYGALVPRRLGNVLVAGRAVGADNAMQASIRVIPGCYITGQAAGMAAAMLAKTDIPARELDVRELRRRLRAIGAYLVKEDPVQ